MSSASYNIFPFGFNIIIGMTEKKIPIDMLLTIWMLMLVCDCFQMGQRQHLQGDCIAAIIRESKQNSGQRNQIKLHYELTFYDTLATLTLLEQEQPQQQQQSSNSSTNAAQNNDEPPQLFFGSYQLHYEQHNLTFQPTYQLQHGKAFEKQTPRDYNNNTEANQTNGETMRISYVVRSTVGVHWFITAEIKGRLIGRICEEVNNYEVAIVCGVVACMSLIMHLCVLEDKSYIRKTKSTVPLVSIFINLHNLSQLLLILLHQFFSRAGALFSRHMVHPTHQEMIYEVNTPQKCWNYTSFTYYKVNNVIWVAAVGGCLITFIYYTVVSCKTLFHNIQSKYGLGPELRFLIFSITIILTLFLFWIPASCLEKGLFYFLYSSIAILGQYFCYACGRCDCSNICSKVFGVFHSRQNNLVQDDEQSKNDDKNKKIAEIITSPQDIELSPKYLFHSHIIIITLLVLSRYYPMLHFQQASFTNILIIQLFILSAGLSLKLYFLAKRLAEFLRSLRQETHPKEQINQSNNMLNNFNNVTDNRLNLNTTSSGDVSIELKSTINSIKYKQQVHVTQQSHPQHKIQNRPDSHQSTTKMVDE